MPNLTDSHGAITWSSLSPGLKLMALTFTLQSTLSCLFLAWASQRIEISPGDSREVAESIPSSSSERNQLDCFPRDVRWNDNKHQKDPVSFTCADARYRIETFSETDADEFLGGRFPESKTLQELGCRSDTGRIVCAEERTVERGPAAGFRAYRSWTASIVNPS